MPPSPEDSPRVSPSRVSPLRAFGTHRVENPYEGRINGRRRKKLKDLSRELPKTPGVYFFFGHKGRLLYIGKAKRLRERVGSYFADSKQKRPPKLRRLLAEIERFEVRHCGSELEALLLERKLIAEHRPLLNRQLKRFDVYPYLLLSDEAFPRLTLTRAEPVQDGIEVREEGEHDFFAPLGTLGGHILAESPPANELENHPRVGELPGLYLGPFTTPRAAWWTFEAVRNLFPLRSCEGEIVPDPNGKGCFYRELKRCAGPCVGDVEQSEYERLCQDLVRALHEGTSPRIEEMRARMMRFSEEWRFEDAAKIKEQLEAIEHVAARLRRLRAMRERNNVAIVQEALPQVLEGQEARRWSVFLVQNGIVRRHVIVRDEPGQWEIVREAVREVFSTPAPAKPFTAKAELDEMMILDRWLVANGKAGCCAWLNAEERGVSRMWATNAMRKCRKWAQAASVTSE
jgi:excinuclease UvrABC nuclease subunit